MRTTMTRESRGTVVAPGRSGIDTTRWPDVAVVPPVSWRTPFARLLLRRVAAPSAYGSSIDLRRTRRRCDVVCRDPERLARRVARDGMIGFGESYMAGEWDAPDLAA